jgi:hypothetical protein
MRLHRLIICTMVSISLLSTSAPALDHARNSPFKGSPLASPHHASYSKVSKAPAVKAEKPAKKAHFWSH